MCCSCCDKVSLPYFYCWWLHFQPIKIYSNFYNLQNNPIWGIPWDGGEERHLTPNTYYNFCGLEFNIYESHNFFNGKNSGVKTAEDNSIQNIIRNHWKEEVASFFRGVKSCSLLCKKSPPSAWAPPATSEYHDQHPLGESSVVRWQSNINMSRLHRKYILASLIFGTFNRNSTRSISVMESPWYKCCVWTGLGWAGDSWITIHEIQLLEWRQLTYKNISSGNYWCIIV